jgi:hypothetical protein
MQAGRQAGGGRYLGRQAGSEGVGRKPIRLLHVTMLGDHLPRVLRPCILMVW